MIRVLHNHAYFRDSPGEWLFFGLRWAPGTIECNAYTLSRDLNAIVPL